MYVRWDVAMLLDMVDTFDSIESNQSKTGKKQYRGVSPEAASDKICREAYRHLKHLDVYIVSVPLRPSPSQA